MKKTRIQYLALNSMVTTVIFFLKLVFTFINRTLLVYIVGIKILGISNLVASIIGVLSLAELGIGTAITYALYKPISIGDTEKRNAYVHLYKKIYKIISIIILFLGLIIFPFLTYFTSENIFNFEFYSIYFLFLINSSVGYLLFAYKRSILEAHQEKYIFETYDFIVYTLFSLIRWGFLILNGNYTLFLILTIINTIVSNVMISYVVDKRYDFSGGKSNLTPQEKESLKKNVLGCFTGQLATVIVFSTDNLLISKFLGVEEIALYGNYTLITTNLNNLLIQLVNSHIPTVGNLISKEDSGKVEEVFKKYHFINFLLVYICSLMVMALISPFVKLWLGDKYILNNHIVLLIAIYFFINSYRNSLFTFIGGYGLYWKQKNKAIIEAIFNIIFSLLFLTTFKLGMEGILLGTICSNLFVNTWYEPFILYKYGFKKSIFNYLSIYLKQIIIFVISLSAIQLIKFNIVSFLDFIIFGSGYFVIILVPIVLFYRNSLEFEYLLVFLKKYFRKFGSLLGELWIKRL